MGIIEHYGHRKPKIYKCEYCGKLMESNSAFVDLEGHVCPYCKKGVMRRRWSENHSIYIGNNNIFEKDLAIGKNAKIIK